MLRRVQAGAKKDMQAKGERRGKEIDMKSVLAAVGAALLTIMFALHAAPSGAQGRPEDKQKQMEQEAADRAKAKKASENAYKSAIDRLAHWCAEGKLSCHVQQVYPLAETPAALKALADRKVMGKLVVRP